MSMEMSEFQEYLDKQVSEEKKVKEQQLLNAVEEKNEDEDEKMRPNLSELLEVNMPRKDAMSPSKDAVPQNSMDEQLQNMQAELDHVHRFRREEREQWQDDNMGWSKKVKQLSQQLSAGETTYQERV